MAVTGGVPRYLEEIIPAESAEANIKRLCFSPSGLLFHEFVHIFAILFSRRGEQYGRIIEKLAAGRATLDELAAACRTTRKNVSQKIDHLIEAGFVARDYTWSLPRATTSTLSRFRLCDNYLRFYVKYIQPNREKIERGAFAGPSAWPTITGLQFENLLLSNRSLVLSALGIDPSDVLCDGPFFQRRSKRAPGCQIDYLVQTKNRCLYACEAKFVHRDPCLSRPDKKQFHLKPNPSGSDTHTQTPGDRPHASGVHPTRIGSSPIMRSFCAHLCMGRVFVVASLGLTGATTASAQSPTPSEAEPSLGMLADAQDPLSTLVPSDPHGLSLAEVLSLARRHAPALAREAAKAQKTAIQSSWAVSVFLPRLDVSGSYTRLSEIQQQAFGAPPIRFLDWESQRQQLDLGAAFDGAFPLIYDNWIFSVAAQVDVSDYFLKLPLFYQIPQHGHAAQLARVQTAEERVALTAAQAYFGLLLARSAAAVTREGAATLQAQVNHLQRLEQAGAVTAGDVMTLAAQSAALEGQVISASGRARLAEIQLRQLIRFTGERIPLAFPMGDEPPAPNPDVDTGVRLAAHQRPELRALREAILMRDAITTGHLTTAFPRLFVRGQYDVANPNQRFFPLADQIRDSWSVTVGLAWSPNDTVTSAQAWRESLAELETLSHDLRALEDAIELEISAALTEWQVAKRRLSATDIGLGAARTAFTDRLQIFAAGEATAQELLEREQAHREAALARIQAATDLHLARLRYDRAVGQLATGPAPHKSPARNTPATMEIHP